MTRLETLGQKVAGLYKAKNPQAAEWIDWGYENHVLVVAKLTQQVAETQHANVEFAVAGALLHDVADAVMARENPKHETESLAMANTLLRDSGFSIEDADFIVKEIIKPHSCSSVLPTSLEGKVLATADSAAHFLTDFYPVFCWRHYGPGDDYQAFKSWVLRKTEKDFTKKIFFEDIRVRVQPRYEAVKLAFSNEVK